MAKGKPKPSSRKASLHGRAFDDSLLVSYISTLPHHRGTYKQLVKELGSRGVERQDFERALEQALTRGQLVEYQRDHFLVAQASTEFISGQLRVHRDGYGFVVPEAPVPGLAGDLFIPPDSATKAMHGDRVLARVGRISKDGRADGEIIKVLKRAHGTVVGEFQVKRTSNWVKPHDDRLREWILIPAGLEFPAASPEVDRIGATAALPTRVEDLQGYIVNVEIIDFPADGEGGTGRVIEILGRPDDFGVDVEIVIRKHHLPHRFPPEVIAEAKAFSAVPEDLPDRRDFRDYDIVTIDGETARDFDDAVWVDTLPNGNFALHVHIADVSHYIQPGSAIDREAYLRGTSVYFPDRAVPMLPLELSTDICSLRPQVDRLVMSALLEINHQGETVSREFCSGVIRSRERMTYADVHLLLEGDPAETAALRERYAPLLSRFQLMKELALILNRQRVRRGSIDFDLPEAQIEFDALGAMTGVTRGARNIAHRLIEEFMLAANEAVASHLEKSGGPSLYRIHETPNPQKVSEFEQIAVHYGVSLGTAPMKRQQITMRGRDGRKVRRDHLTPSGNFQISSKSFQRLIKQLEGKPEERILSYLMLRSLKQARYSSENSGHFALATGSYTHFTSPIRRYPDLVIHRLLRALLTQPGHPPYSESQLRQIGDDTSLTERRAAEAERDLLEWKKAKFMAERVGDEFTGLITSTAKFGFFVELDTLFIEGLVAIESLFWDRFLYDERTRKLTGERTRKSYALGDRVKVRVDRVEAQGGRIQFSLAEGVPERKKRK
ncbi:MAG: VacB/RNase II family 3'-5' exoribonuclease [Bryobacteraceae bacterium]|nr:VacB/RNase II family 3'-5' exoribonuclease [Bryobacteraceae bacterium]